MPAHAAGQLIIEEYIVAKNVLFILADQLIGADCLGAAGNEGVKTPNLDRLAAQGVRFANCFNQTARPVGPVVAEHLHQSLSLLDAGD